MTKAVSTRISEETVEKLDEIAEEEHLDRATLLRKMLEEDVEEYLKRKAAESYSRGEKSIEAAAARADVSVWQMIQYTQKHNIESPSDDVEGLEQEYRESEEV
ncbi:MAG: ribbon-helix-helix protein, CopG family [Candidatus Nanohaloarchaea archaeon]